LIGNTPEETVDATDEMDQRLNEKWESNKEDEELQHVSGNFMVLIN